MDAEALFQIACELTQKNELTKAISIYKQIITSNQDARYLISYSTCLQKLGHWEQSIIPLEKAIQLKLHYGEADARLFLAEAYLKTKQTKKAIEQWKIVKVMQPTYPSYDHPINVAKKLLTTYSSFI